MSFQKRYPSPFRPILHLNSDETLLLSGVKVALVVRGEQTWYTARRQLSHAHYFRQDMTLAVFSDACCISYLSNLPLLIGQHEIVDICHKNRCGTTLKLVERICDGRHQRTRVTASKRSLISLFDFPSKNQTRITDRIF